MKKAGRMIDGTKRRKTDDKELGQGVFRTHTRKGTTNQPLYVEKGPIEVES